MYPILFSISNINFYSYGFFVALAFIVCYLVLYLLAKKEKLPIHNLLEKLLLVFLIGVIFSRISFVILYPQLFNNWKEYFYFWQGGLISFGGMLGGIIAFVFFFKQKLLRWLDIFTLGFFIGAVSWRIGCFLSGEHPTVSSTAWYAISGHAPAILFEMIASLAAFIIFSFIYQKKWIEKGVLIFYGLIWYGLTRVVVDRWRDDPFVWGEWRGGQIVGVFLVLVGIISIIAMWYKKQSQK